MTSSGKVTCPLVHIAELLKSASEHQRWKAYPEAERLWLEALEFGREQLGPDHPAVGTALADLGQGLVEQGRPLEGREYLIQALTNLEKNLGNSDPQVLWIFSHLHELFR